jgi:hypothetical protein
MAELCPGICNRRYRHAQALYRAALARHDEKLAGISPGQPVPDPPEQPDIRPWHGDPWCLRCQSNIHQQLAALDDLACIVKRFADGQRGAANADVKLTAPASPASPSPALDALEEMMSDLRHWESRVRGGEPPGRRGDLAEEITTVVSWLSAHFRRAITHPAVAVELGEGVETWYRRLTSRGRAGSARELKPMPCPGCRHMSLYQESGSKYVECGRKVECGRLLALDEYDEREDAWRTAREKAAKTGKATAGQR